ncbi:MAG: hypothetical protein C5B53_10630 [Candidatus Melainabacteria bacterium]|nr:MAG: hypothetical protein C5B53_10630 [Candidatus Melainabacteria bacterium]
MQVVPDEKRRVSLKDLAVSKLFVVPKNLEQSIGELVEDLTEVPVVGSDGRGTDIFKKIESEPLLDAEDKKLIWSCLAIVREAFINLDREASLKDQETGYQWNMNWKHTRAELDQVLEAAKLLKLNKEDTKAALIASIFSDSVKTRQNFLIHNIHGSEAAAQVLDQLLDQSLEANKMTVRRVVKAVKEHQIAPPEFMARAVSITLSNKLNLSQSTSSNDEITDERLQARELVDSIFNKIKDPFNKKHLLDDLSRIDFSDEERDLLAQVGIDDWWVPHPDSPDSLVAHAVIAGDHSINYNHPEGFAKIALIRGPNTEPIFEDPTVHHSLLSALHSFADSFRIIKPEVQALAMDGLRRTMSALARVNAVMSQIFAEAAKASLPDAPTLPSGSQVLTAIARAQAENPSLFFVDSKTADERVNKQVSQALDRVAAILEDWWMNYGEIPFDPEQKSEGKTSTRSLPFWNTALAYPPRDASGKAQFDKFNELQLRQYKFATRIRAIAVELLRAEQWIVGSTE